MEKTEWYEMVTENEEEKEEIEEKKKKGKEEKGVKEEKEERERCGVRCPASPLFHQAKEHGYIKVV